MGVWNEEPRPQPAEKVSSLPLTLLNREKLQHFYCLISFALSKLYENILGIFLVHLTFISVGVETSNI